MNYFLILYDGSTRSIIEEEEFSSEDRHLALERRFALEKEYRDAPNVEVVVFGSESHEALEHTHSRYFKTVSQMTNSLHG